jgi:lipid-binding SYLF domain-containing protein
MVYRKEASMKNIACIFVFLIILSLCPSPAAADQGKEEPDLIVDKARIVIGEIMLREEEKIISEDLLSRCSGLVIIPGMIKGGFVVAGSYGKGVILAHTNGRWTGPAFVYLAAGSVGVQIGVESVDLILVIFGQKTMESFLKTEFKLGVDAALAAGPIGAQVTAATDIMLKGGIYSYSRAKGLFFGFSLEGAGMGTDFDLNRAYYETTSSPDMILYGGVETPTTGKKLLETLGKIK